RATPRRSRTDSGRRAPRCRSRGSEASHRPCQARRSPSRTRSRPRAPGGNHSSARSSAGTVPSDPGMAHRVTLIPGDGTGPELTEATRRVLEATGLAFEWDVREAGVDVMESAGTPLPDETLASV